MESIRTPFRGIIQDLKGRKACYEQDWASGVCCGARYPLGAINCLIFRDLANHQILFDLVYFRILAPTTYVFFASALPVIAFGEQLSRETGNSSCLSLCYDDGPHISSKSSLLLQMEV